MVGLLDSDISNLTKQNKQIKKSKMSEKTKSGWKNLPDLIFSDIGMMVNLEELKKLRQICQSWNVMISEMTKHGKSTIRRRVESRAAQIKEKWIKLSIPLLPDIVTAASLAHDGLLGSVLRMRLENVDLASVSTEHLASLASCLTGFVGIHNVSDINLISFLDNIKCRDLAISSQSLGSEETRALVRTMEKTVERVALGDLGDGEITLDIPTLTQYSGRGRCGVVMCWTVTADKYREEMRSWAQRSSWAVTWNDMVGISTVRSVIQ